MARSELRDLKYFIGDRYIHSTSGAVGYFLTENAKKKILDLKNVFHLADDWQLLYDCGIKIGYLKNKYRWHWELIVKCMCTNDVNLFYTTYTDQEWSIISPYINMQHPSSGKMIHRAIA